MRMRKQTHCRGSISKDTRNSRNARIPAQEDRAIKMLPIMILGVALVLLTATAGCTGTNSPVVKTILPSTITVPVSVVPTTTAQLTLTSTPDPFPHALTLKQVFPFGNGSVASEGTVYRYWINETYHWLDNLDNHYYTAPEQPMPGYKYLFIFVRMENIGTTRVWYPPATIIAVHYNGNTYWPDSSHYLPDKATDEKDTPVLIQEVQYFQKLDGSEYVEDFGYSHGTHPDFLYPGASNALDGYIIYIVPDSLSANDTYVDIPFNDQDRGIWKLA
jgi:hypothetical protein